MSKWTPGPWHACMPIGNPPFVGNENRIIVQRVGPLWTVLPSDRIEAECNAMLIAAAPEMAELLAGLTDGSRDIANVAHEARAILASINREAK